MTTIVIKVLGASALPTERTLLAFIGDPIKGLAVMTCVISGSLGGIEFLGQSYSGFALFGEWA